MASTIVRIVNLGQLKIGASRINSITPAQTTNEKIVAEQYTQWRDSELSKKRWVFATTLVLLTQSAPNVNPNDPCRYVYDLPADCLKPLRDEHSTWKVRGKQLYSYGSTQVLEYIASKTEDAFVPLFVDVLAARCALELVEPQTQSNDKWQKAQSVYNQAVKDAAAANAYIIGSEDQRLEDEHSEWVMARQGDPFNVPGRG